MAKVYQNINGKLTQVTPDTSLENTMDDISKRVDNLHITGQYTLPPATTTKLGGVIPDGKTITVDADGTVHAAAQSTLVASDAEPMPRGDSAETGMSLEYSRADHVHQEQDVPPYAGGAGSMEISADTRLTADDPKRLTVVPTTVDLTLYMPTPTGTDNDDGICYIITNDGEYDLTVCSAAGTALGDGKLPPHKMRYYMQIDEEGMIWASDEWAGEGVYDNGKKKWEGMTAGVPVKLVEFSVQSTRNLYLVGYVKFDDTTYVIVSYKKQSNNKFVLYMQLVTFQKNDVIIGSSLELSALDDLIINPSGIQKIADENGFYVFCCIKSINDFGNYYVLVSEHIKYDGVNLYKERTSEITDIGDTSLASIKSYFVLPYLEFPDTYVIGLINSAATLRLVAVQHYNRTALTNISLDSTVGYVGVLLAPFSDNSVIKCLTIASSGANRLSIRTIRASTNGRSITAFTTLYSAVSIAFTEAKLRYAISDDKSAVYCLLYKPSFTRVIVEISGLTNTIKQKSYNNVSQTQPNIIYSTANGVFTSWQENAISQFSMVNTLFSYGLEEKSQKPYTSVIPSIHWYTADGFYATDSIYDDSADCFYYTGISSGASISPIAFRVGFSSGVIADDSIEVLLVDNPSDTTSVFYSSNILMLKVSNTLYRLYSYIGTTAKYIYALPISFAK